MTKEEKEHKPCKTCLMAIKAVKEEESQKTLELTAELENFKLRQKREMEKFKKLVNKETMKSLLPIMDSLEEFMLMFYEDDITIKKLGEGVDAIISLFDYFLEVNNVTPFRSLGEEFDPNFHNAVGFRENTKHPKNTIVEVFRKGYMLDDTLLRPADVMLSKNREEEE